MPNLETKYMGMSLKNPIIAASSGLTRSAQKIQQCEDAGAGAVVVKSLFEEVLAQEDWTAGGAENMHPEAYDYVRSELKMQYAPNDYCDIISDAKNKVKIPVIASINCKSTKWWPDFAKKIESAGADGLELNVYKTAIDTDTDGIVLEKLYYDILDEVKSKVKIPIAMKIGNSFSSIPGFISQLSKRGLDSVVMFNRFAEPDIDIDNLKLKTTFTFSHPDELNRILRWTAIMAGRIKSDISATTGIHNAKAVIKAILAGASTVQLASILYKKGVDHISVMLKEIEEWMTVQKFKKIKDFKGRLTFSHSDNPEVYLRAQFMEKIRGIE